MNIMHTMASDAATTPAPKRRFYSPELKLQVVSACAQPGASIAGVAMQHGINANIVHRWLHERSQGTLISQRMCFRLRITELNRRPQILDFLEALGKCQPQTLVTWWIVFVKEGRVRKLLHETAHIHGNVARIKQKMSKLHMNFVLSTYA